MVTSIATIRFGLMKKIEYAKAADQLLSADFDIFLTTKKSD
jgi:hypothetical protein